MTDTEAALMKLREALEHLAECVRQDAIRNTDSEDKTTKCKRCNGTGWLEGTDMYSDGSYLSMRPCKCVAGNPHYEY